MSTSTSPPAVTTDDGDDSLLKRALGLQAIWILGVLIVICVSFSIGAGNRFLSAGNFSLISQNVAVWAVLGVGMTFVIITSGIDLSVGSVLVFSSVIAAKVMDAMGGDGPGVAAVGLLAAVLSGTVWGSINGVLVAKARVPALIVTLGTLSVALGLAQVVTGGIDIRSVPSELTDFSAYIKVLGIPGLPFVALIVVILGAILLHETRFGRYTYAIGSNQEAARRTGIKVTRHLIAVYAFTGMLAGFGALLSLAQYGTTTIAGQSLTNLNVIAAVVIGGTSIFGGEGTVFGTLIGLFIPAVLQSGFVIIGVQPYWQGVAVGSVLIAAVYVDQSPAGCCHAQRTVSKPLQTQRNPTKGKHMNHRRLALVAGVMTVALPMAACTSSKPQSAPGAPSSASASGAAATTVTAPPKASKEYSIALLQGVVGDQFYITMQCGAQDEAANLGVKVNTQGPQKFDPTLQKPVLDSIVASKPDALLVAPTDVQAMQQPLEQAAAAGIKVVLVDTTTNDPSFAVSAIASDNQGGGAAAFDAIKQLHPDGGKVMVMGLEPGVSTTDARAKGFEDAVKADPKFDYVGVQYSHDDPATAAQLVGAQLQKDPDLVGVFAVNLFSAEGSATGVKQAGRSGQVQIVGFDAGPNQIQALREGTVQALVAQEPSDIGKFGVDEAVTALEGGKNTRNVQTGFTIITKDNLDGRGGAAAYKSNC